MTAHTPTPWKRFGDTGITAVGEPRMIAQIGMSFYHQTELRDANAAFIVRAVNAHEALVQALEEALLWINVDDQGASEMLEKWRNVLKQTGES